MNKRKYWVDVQPETDQIQALALGAINPTAGSNYSWVMAYLGLNSLSGSSQSPMVQHLTCLGVH